MISAINGNKDYKPPFKASFPVAATAYIEERLPLNKAILDASVDVPIVLSANNKVERRERFNRAAIGWTIAFASPYITLPLTNKLAMKHIAKLSKSFNAKESKLIRLSNDYLGSTQKTKEGIELLSKELKTDFSEALKAAGGDYEKVRQKLLNAKNAVLGFDFALTASALSGIAYFNNWQTKKKTQRDGFSAEFNMADKSVIDERAKKFQNTEWLRKSITIGTIAALATTVPIAIKKGLGGNSTAYWAKLARKHANKFDYTDGILMKRLPLFLTLMAAYLGVSMASRNQTEVKDNLIRAAVGQTAFFGGDIVIGSVLGRLSDKFLKTDIINKKTDKSLLNKLIPPIRPLRELEGKSKNIAAGLFWVNLATLSLVMGRATPYLLNKMIKRDVQKDAQKQEPVTLQKNFNYYINKKAFIN